MILEILAIKEINKPPEIPQPKPTVTIKVEKKKETKPKKRYYTIKKNDTITKVSKRFRVPVSRVICANKQLDNPDFIMPSERLRIPHKKDKLKCAKIKPSDTKPNKPLVNSGGFSSSENLYEYHQCTWYAKSRRPDLPNNLGNADTWVVNASAQGFATGSTPRAGAVGQQGMHVVYIERVKGNQVYLSDRNYDYNGSYRERWANASDFLYIY